MRPVTLHPYVARRAPAKSVPTVEVDVHVVPGHMHTPCVHGVEGAAAVVAREGGSSAAGHRVLKPLLSSVMWKFLGLHRNLYLLVRLILLD